uniref:Hemicentin-2-like n=1 Tax=Cyprinodon variegatus TaxID=28743 RepID=A0A3Q2CZ87_CYPVA
MDDFSWLRLLSVIVVLMLPSLSNGTKSSDVEECPIEIQPDSMVLEYQSGGHSAVCMPTTSESNVKEIYWEVHGDKFNNRSWSPDTHENWDPSPVCHGEFLGIGSCNKTLPYILYKPPDDVSITISNMSTKEGSKIELMCSIRNVAPADRLNVTWTWQRGNETVDPDSLGVSNEAKCPPSNKTSAVDVTCTMNITLNRTHNGIQARCEAELNLGPKGPQPPPTMSSNSFNLSVQYGPKINKTKLQKLFLVIRGYKGELVCEADGNPAPDIKWNYTSKTAFLESDETLIVNEEGLYVCTATNNISSDTHRVEVVLGEDYLPLLAGFVALTVVIISIIFIFIYSIYYKNTKMRRYSLKNPKLSSHNGNVAHNSWDIQLPVTKLS